VSGRPQGPPKRKPARAAPGAGKPAAKAGRRRPAAAQRLTGPVEDYLKAIYELERAGTAAATTDLAVQLKLAPASVTGMIRRLAGQGLLTHRRYRGVRLTVEGRKAALGTIRRHRVIETYLVKVLGYRWDEVHDEAERLEHAATDGLVDRMAAAIGEPTVDPHGAPIPTREGAVEELRFRTLADLPAGTTAEVMHVADEDPALLRYLADLTITPGCAVRVVERTPFGGPITLQLGRRTRVVGPALAERVLVRPRRP
jgi:DtxR family transcriptional regulator, Mn-dependent transcriptional regulator